MAHFFTSRSVSVVLSRYACGLLFKVRGFTSQDDANNSTTAGDSAGAVFDALGVALVGMCTLILLWAAVLVVAAIGAHVRRVWIRRKAPGGNVRRAKAAVRRRRRGQQAVALPTVPMAGTPEHVASSWMVKNPMVKQKQPNGSGDKAVVRATFSPRVSRRPPHVASPDSSVEATKRLRSLLQQRNRPRKT